VPKGDKRPLDEFYDLGSIEDECVLPPIDITTDQDGGLIKYVVIESDSKFQRCCEKTDVVYYTHCTRFDNGQLVDFDERRKAKEKFEMSDTRGHEHIRAAFLTMRRGDVAWIKIGPKYHGNIYHTYCKKEHLLADQKLGPDIYIRLFIDQIKRVPVQKDSKTFEGKMEYFETVREICKELVAENELANAQ
jgi:hypothetical protein